MAEGQAGMRVYNEKCDPETNPFSRIFFGKILYVPEVHTKKKKKN